ncbi:hypothetical protein [Bacillus sp. AFS014408]|uniref:hypothetical protein n=1 Tax=Bacillus sp. AFS014408 TaxID=2034278 RepID=UPI0015964B67|nr:hypothetical protein [Bacillus sp. AFS014408]
MIENIILSFRRSFLFSLEIYFLIPNASIQTPNIISNIAIKNRALGNEAVFMAEKINALIDK